METSKEERALITPHTMYAGMDEWQSGYLKGALDQERLACKAYCKLQCPHLMEYCWEDPTDTPCKGFEHFKFELDI